MYLSNFHIIWILYDIAQDDLFWKEWYGINPFPGARATCAAHL